MSSTNETLSAKPALPVEPLRVNGITAARLMGVSKTTFYERVKDGTYPKAGTDGLWSVRRLRECSDRLDEPEPQPE